MLVGDKETIGPVPVPVRFVLCGLFEASSVTVSVPFRVPAVVGVKVTVI
jgi:hypothetical protein